MNFMKLVSPAAVLPLIRGQIKKQLNKEVTEFDIYYFLNEDKIYFIIEGKKYLFLSDTLKNLIETQVKSKLKKEQVLDAVEINVSKDNKILAKIYLVESGRKFFITHNLN